MKDNANFNQQNWEICFLPVMLMLQQIGSVLPGMPHGNFVQFTEFCSKINNENTNPGSAPHGNSGPDQS